jgi:hypothetical protein
MNNPDQEILIRAVEDARRILGEYIEPGPRDATRTVERLLAILDRNDVILALDRIKRRRVIKAGGMIQEIAAPGFRPQVVK